ncbi:MAG: phage shock protein A [Methyloprofundus sp.]|nr:MAG: phage shock protein A [Methyloprofundus sp.]
MTLHKKRIIIMSSLKRIFVSIKSQIDHVADDFENHEALAAAAIQDLQAIAGKTNLHLHRISKMSAQYQKQLGEQQEQAQLWSERAIQARETDEQTALQCVKRLRQVQKLIAVRKQQLEQSIAQEEKIRSDLEAIQEQLQDLKNKKEILAARQNRASVKDALYDKQGNSLQDVQNVFDRWEGSVVSSEFDTPETLIEIDTLAKDFEQAEDDLALKMMLDELTAESNTSEDKN